MRPIILFIDGKAYSIAYFGAGSGKIWMDDVACSSSHTQLIYCPSSILGTSNCGHSEDAGVGCEGKKFAIVTLYNIPSIAPCNDGDIRLTGNSNVPQEGRVEYCLNNNWGTICGTSWGAPDAQVACRQLGYPTTGQQSY